MSQCDFSPRNKRQKEGRVPTKIVVRRLPPNFTAEIFKVQVSPLPEYNYFYFVNACKVDKAHSFSRVYINFICHEDMFTFKEKYDNYVFLGPKGAEYPAVVEFAPFQKIPKNRLLQKDIKCGTIQNNEYYMQFINNLKVSRCESIERPEYDLQLNTQVNEAEDITPLLKYVSAKKFEQIKNRIERKRESKVHINENSLVFVNSSVKKNINRRVGYISKGIHNNNNKQLTYIKNVDTN